MSLVKDKNSFQVLELHDAFCYNSTNTHPRNSIGFVESFEICFQLMFVGISNNTAF